MTTRSITPRNPRGAVALVASIAVTLGVGAVGGLATASSVTTWYAGLNKPAFNPPNAVFGPVWTTLYVLMAVAAWRVWRRASPLGAGPALMLYVAQLILNLGWSLIFFGLRQPGWAMIEVVCLLTAVAATTVAFWRSDRPAGLMMLPYAAWVGFASLLNLEIWRLN